MEIGDRIKLKRIEKSMSLTDLSNATKINAGTLTKYEKNINKPSVENLIALSQSLEVGLNWLIIGKEEISNLSYEEINILKKYNLLTERNKGKVETYIDERIAEQESKYTNDKTNLA